MSRTLMVAVAVLLGVAVSAPDRARGAEPPTEPVLRIEPEMHGVGQTGRITHKMLDFYVAERVKALTKGQQTPVNTSPQGVPDFPIAVVK